MSNFTEQWVNIYKSKKHGSYWTGAFCYKTKEEAVKDLADKENYLTTVNIEDMLQKTENVAKNVANENLQDLTALWKNGELPKGAYYCNTGNQIEILYTWGKKYNQLTNNKDAVFIPEMDDCIIVGSVPSYEQNIKLQKHSNTLKQALAALDEEQVRSDKLENALTLCRNWLADMVGVMNNENAEHNKKLPVGNFERAMKDLLQTINEVI